MHYLHEILTVLMIMPLVMVGQESTFGMQLLFQKMTSGGLIQHTMDRITSPVVVVVLLIVIMFQ